METQVIQHSRRLRTPEERVGCCQNVSLPPPVAYGHPATDDDLLLRALRDRDEAAFVSALDRHFRGMLRVAMGHVHSRAIAEEVIQETWLAALRGIDRFEGRSSVRTWLYQILRNLARARGRRDARMLSFADVAHGSGKDGGLDPLEWIVDGPVADDGHGAAALWVTGSDPERRLLDRELAGRIESAIDALPPRQREVIQLRDVEGWSAVEVCNTLGISDTNQRVLLHRARDRVREELRGYLDDEEPRGKTESDELL